MKDTLVIFQCCKRKNGVEQFPREDFNIESKIPRTKHILRNAIAKFSQDGIIETDTEPVTALSQYNGYFYSVPGFRRKVAEEIRHGPSDFLIMSASYGFVHPFQKIHKYEQRMAGRVTKYWLSIELPEVLEEFIETGKFKYIYGFFSESADYRKVFEEISWHNLKNVSEAGYFYLTGIQGTTKILRFCSSLMLNLVQKRFQNSPSKFNEAKVNFVKTHCK